MMTELGDRRTPRSGISDDEIRKLVDDGLSVAAIAQHFTERGRPITKQGVHYKLRRIRENDANKEYLLPWTVATAHTTGFVYRAVVAYAKGMRGEALTQRQQAERRQLMDQLAELDAVVTYDYHRGFLLRNRHPGDGAYLLVKS